jgi:lipopolysaccharide transport system ATP-binding protein
LRYRTLRESLTGAFTWAGRAASTEQTTLWALDDVSFEVARGEVIGIIGANGAGKSTLLKILSRITKPTRGRVEIRGRVGSLLEVGTGFHAELTGRENVYLNGSILGMKRREIDQRFDEIVAFAEMDRFLDTPVKRYSSGMYMRLAFAVAAHLDPEILLVDEVLAVGDAAFQAKCIGKMGDVSRAGRTVLLVSHNMAAIQGLCSTAVWLDGGGVAAQGETHAVVRQYLQRAAALSAHRIWDDDDPAAGNHQVRLRRVDVRSAEADDGVLSVRTPVTMDFELELLREAAVSLSILLYDEAGILVFNAGNICKAPLAVGRYCHRCTIPGDLLNDGRYFVSVLAVKNDADIILRCDQAVAFDVADSADMRGAWYGKWPGVVRPALDWSVERIGP